MKKLTLTALAVTCAVGVYAQGTVQFNNRVAGSLISYVYYNAGVHSSVIGNGTADTPAGTNDWTGWTRISGSGYMAALLAANGAGQSESALSFGATPQTTTFRTGGAAGNIAGFVATMSNLTPDVANGTFEVFAWDRAGSGISDPVQALAAWKAGTILGGTSGTFTVAAVGGLVNTPPVLTGWQSFNIYIVPEPATVALAGLGGAALLIFRRRK
jgi:hypothetical protein